MLKVSTNINKYQNPSKNINKYQISISPNTAGFPSWTRVGEVFKGVSWGWCGIDWAWCGVMVFEFFFFFEKLRCWFSKGKTKWYKMQEFFEKVGWWEKSFLNWWKILIGYENGHVFLSIDIKNLNVGWFGGENFCEFEFFWKFYKILNYVRCRKWTTRNSP